MELVEKEAITVVGLPVRARWQELWGEMPRVWTEFLTRHVEIQHRVRAPFLDVSLEQTGDEYLQLVAAQVSRVQSIPDGMRAVEIPAQQYFFHEHRGPVPEVVVTFGKIYDWARKQGHAPGQFKLDFGYTLGGDEVAHGLFVGLLPEKRWRDLDGA